MRIFLSASYHRRLELCGYRDELLEMGHEVTSRWLEGPNMIIPNKGYPTELGKGAEKAIEDGQVFGPNYPTHVLAELAGIDLNDIMDAECFVNFTESPESDASRGGRHVEFGMFLAFAMKYTQFSPMEHTDRMPTRPIARVALARRIIIVSHRENLFHWLPAIEFAVTWEAAKALL